MTTAPSTARFERRPAVTSSAIAVVAGVAAVALIATDTVQQRILTVAVLGVVAVAFGWDRWREEREELHGALLGGGAVLLVAAAFYAATGPPQLTHRLELFPAVVGVATLLAGLLPVRFQWSRLLVDVGTGLLFVAVLVSGVVRGATPAALVIAAALVVLAWDAGENAVSMGGQVGETPSTRRAELVHVGVTAAVAGVAVVAVLAVAGLGVDGLPFAALGALLVAAIALTLVYHD